MCHPDRRDSADHDAIDDLAALERLGCPARDDEGLNAAPHEVLSQALRLLLTAADHRIIGLRENTYAQPGARLLLLGSGRVSRRRGGVDGPIACQRPPRDGYDAVLVPLQRR